MLTTQHPPRQAGPLAVIELVPDGEVEFWPDGTSAAGLQLIRKFPLRNGSLLEFHPRFDSMESLVEYARAAGPGGEWFVDRGDGTGRPLADLDAELAAARAAA